MVLDAIFDYIKESVIVAGVTWLIGMLNPVSAFFKACKAIYDIVMFFINRGSQIIALVNAIVDSIAAIAKGSVGVAATMVENALAKAIPVAIGFLASLLSLGDIGSTVKKIIDKAQAPINKAIDWVIGKAVMLVKAAGKAIGGLFGPKDKKDKDEDKGKQKQTKEEEGQTGDPVHDAKLEAGLAALDQEQAKHLHDGKLNKQHAQNVAATVRSSHPFFKSITPVEKDGRWFYEFVASKGTKKGAEVDESDQIFKIESFGPRKGFSSETRESITLETGEHRRHIGAWDALHHSLLLKLNGKPVSYGIDILTQVGFPPTAKTQQAVKEAGYKYLLKQNNDTENLWAGPGRENSSLGARARVAREKALEEIASDRPNRERFEDAIKELKETWIDPDPSGQKAGRTLIASLAIARLQLQFYEKHGRPEEPTKRRSK
jgi:hypothetical protein